MWRVAQFFSLLAFSGVKLMGADGATFTNIIFDVGDMFLLRVFPMLEAGSREVRAHHGTAGSSCTCI